MHVLSPRIEVTLAPSSSAPLSDTSAIASSAPAPIAGVIDSSGPVKPRMTPILTSFACPAAKAVPVINAVAAVAIKNFFML